MSKKRSHKQASSHGNHSQHPRHHLDDKTVCEGLVITRYSRHAHVEDQQGHAIHCAIRSHISSLVAGDRVYWQPEGLSQGSIIDVLPRHTVLNRPDAQGHLKPIAANITQIMIVIAPIPLVSWLLLDSYLVMAETLQLQPYIILNKTDLEIASIQQYLLQNYEPLGYPLLFTNIKSQDLSSLQKSLRQQTSVFVGQSGVGKSSLIARLLPEEATKIKTGQLSHQSQFGCHTTSNSHLYHIPLGGDLIDSPGIRELSLWSMPSVAVAHGFREFRSYQSQCKFRNCTHHETPNCAVIEAVKSQKISEKRYENYVKIITNID
ncbi:MAG: ribosome small subunit-dependent GTPase A [Gammaproteobacteria bacterium]